MRSSPGPFAHYSQSDPGTDLKKGDHQVGNAQVDHEHVHGRVVFPPPQQHPQDKAVPQGGEGQHQAEHCDLSPGEAGVPHPGLGQCVRRGGGTILREDPEEGSPAVRAVDGVQPGGQQRRQGEVGACCSYR